MEFFTMDLLWAILGGLLIIIGIVGCFLPVIPGPPLAYAGLLMLQLKEEPPFDTNFLLVWLAIVIVVTALDYLIPIYGTKKLGGSKKGIYGSMAGLLLGVIFFPPFGIIIGPMLGAIAGELIDGKQTKEALKSGIGSFLGFLAGTLLKLMACCIMAYYFFWELF